MNSDFKKWATGYSGFDGGNPNGEIWICGIEWGGDAPKDIQMTRELFNEDVSKIKEGYENHETNLLFNYNKRVINIIGSILDPNFKTGEDELLNKINNQEKFFTKNSNSFKLNLSPFNFPMSSEQYWNNDYIELTGFNTKKEYEKWVWEERKKLFQEMTSKYKPKLIMTFGTDKKKGYINIFKDFFGFSKENLITVDYLCDKRLSLRYAYSNGILFTNLFFPSNGWLVSPNTLSESGKIIRDLLQKYDISIKLTQKQ